MKTVIRHILTLFVLTASMAVGLVANAQPPPPAATPIAANVFTVNNAVNAQAFNPNTQFIVEFAQLATAEAGEPVHMCSAPQGTGSDTVWFQSWLQPGTVNLDTTGSTLMTAGGQSTDTVVSLYRLTSATFGGFGDLSLVTCNDNGTGPGNINAFPIIEAAPYYIQVSSSPLITVTGQATMYLTATANPINAPSMDAPENAAALKLLGMPSVVHFDSATRSLNEPVDPYLAEYIALVDPTIPNYVTNSIWFTFTLKEQHFLDLVNAVPGQVSLWFSVFEAAGDDYVRAGGTYLGQAEDNLTVRLDPGTYSLRVAALGAPAGVRAAIYIMFEVRAYLGPQNYTFAVMGTEYGASAQADTGGWTLKNTTAGPGGDGIACHDVMPYACYLQLTSSGADENTSATTKTALNPTKIKKGDILIYQVVLLDVVGQPNLAATLTLTGKGGAKQTYKLRITNGSFGVLIANAPGKLTATGAKMKIKNKDTTAGNRVRVDAAVAQVSRKGEGVLRGPTGMFSVLTPALGLPAPAAEGALPPPPPAQ